MTSNKNPREWLKQIRKEEHLTQKEMASKLGIPKTTYASYEQGHRTPEVDTAKVLGEKLNIKWTYFFDSDVRESTT